MYFIETVPLNNPAQSCDTETASQLSQLKVEMSNARISYITLFNGGRIFSALPKRTLAMIQSTYKLQIPELVWEDMYPYHTFVKKNHSTDTLHHDHHL